VVALGSNMAGDYPSREALLEAALTRFPQAGLPVLARSRWWRSAAWPDPREPEYRNGVVLVEAKAGPEVMLAALLGIERAFGREPGPRNAPRTLDLDLIAYGRQVIRTPELTLPHPRAHERAFVMGPLAEIAPEWRHPEMGLLAAELARTASTGREAEPCLGPGCT
jgi:2-amino-4-hydroxy-6-hydroxymethyldihydropteridine diphosphokinase